MPVLRDDVVIALQIAIVFNKKTGAKNFDKAFIKHNIHLSQGVSLFHLLFHYSGMYIAF
jgi:hypothetical protein